jgi:hypothetical protein
MPFLIVGGLELWVASTLPWWGAWAFAWAGAATSWVGLAYLAKKPGWLGKDPETGQLGRMHQLMLKPFFVGAHSLAKGGSSLMPVNKVEVVPGLWVGAWPLKGAHDQAVLDLTSELPRKGPSKVYACFPMLDGAGPKQEVFEKAVEQAVVWRREGHTVLVHCAYGHGRSAMVCAGVLLAEGLAKTPEEAWGMVVQARPRARLSPGQKRVLDGKV